MAYMECVCGERIYFFCRIYHKTVCGQDKCEFFIAISLIDGYNQIIIILYCIVSVFDNSYSLLEYSISYRFCKIPVKTGTCKKENDLKLKVIISIRHRALCFVSFFIAFL